jgi:hypothetical protein
MNRAVLPGLLLLCCCSPLSPSPAKKPINSYLADPRDLHNVRRVMVLPFTASSGVTGDAERVRSAYVAELAKLRRFEIVPLPTSAQEVEVLNQGLLEGSMSTDATVRLCNHFHLDGLLLGVITSWRPYTPQHLGLRTQLLSVHSGTTVWAADAIYDCNDQTTINDLRHYSQYVQAAESSLHGWEINTIAPGKFASYVSFRLVGTWREG